ncbi:hypothetical protein G6L37_00355 [Agrobacterium rubi]|nr:hypothetical protein [Agrobacterium rubi]NTF23840.1 hypothetical protein [Agrobacterium rubi]
MLAPIRLGDPLYPIEECYVDGIRHERTRVDWDREKQISLHIRTLRYYLQFPKKHGDAVVANMIDAFHAVDYGGANCAQKAALDELLAIRRSWKSVSVTAHTGEC